MLCAIPTLTSRRQPCILAFHVRERYSLVGCLFYCPVLFVLVRYQWCLLIDCRPCSLASPGTCTRNHLVQIQHRLIHVIHGMCDRRSGYREGIEGRWWIESPPLNRVDLWVITYALGLPSGEPTLVLWAEISQDDSLGRSSQNGYL